MLNKEIWQQFWFKLQSDIADCLQEQIFNFDTSLGLCLTILTYYYPEYIKIWEAVAIAYLGWRKK